MNPSMTGDNGIFKCAYCSNQYESFTNFLHHYNSVHANYFNDTTLKMENASPYIIASQNSEVQWKGEDFVVTVDESKVAVDQIENKNGVTIPCDSTMPFPNNGDPLSPQKEQQIKNNLEIVENGKLVKWKCNICTWEFERSDLFNEHIRCWHSPNDDKWLEYQRLISNNTDRRNSISGNTWKPRVNLKQDKTKDGPETENIYEWDYQCYFCPYIGLYSTFSEHVKSHHALEWLKCRNTNLSNEQSSSYLKCRQCQYSINIEIEFKKHVEQVHGAKFLYNRKNSTENLPYRCPHCNWAFADVLEFRRHVDALHLYSKNVQ